MFLNPTPCVGVDVGKTEYHVCLALPDVPYAKWPVQVIDLTQPDWPARLIDLIPPGAVIVCEPAGFHLMSPLAHVVQAYTTAALWLIDNQATRDIRRQHISRAKTDAIDARALALAARMIGTEFQPRTARLYDFASESAAMELRLHLNAYLRIKKSSTRLQLQLDALAFSLWPLLSQKRNTWLNAVALGAVDCFSIRALVENPPAGVDRRTFRHIERLAEGLPPFYGHPAIVASVQEIASNLNDVEAQAEARLQVVAALIDQPPFKAVSDVWRTVPGSGTASIAALHVATKGQAEQYSLEAFKAALALANRTSQSGSASTVKRAQAGYRPAKGMLTLWTMSLLNPQAEANPIRHYFAGKAEGSRRLQAARSKLARVLHALALSKQPCRW